MNVDARDVPLGLARGFLVSGGIVLFKLSPDPRRPGASIRSTSVGAGGRFLKANPKRDRKHGREPVNPEYTRGLAIKIAKANQVQLEQRR